MSTIENTQPIEAVESLSAESHLNDNLPGKMSSPHFSILSKPPVNQLIILSSDHFRQNHLVDVASVQLSFHPDSFASGPSSVSMGKNCLNSTVALIDWMAQSLLDLIRLTAGFCHNTFMIENNFWSLTRC